MIVKRSHREGGSSFKKLAQYILADGKAKSCWVANCADDMDFELSIKEIEATQSLNTRSKADKTYHLIVSFAENERPSLEIIKDIEEAFVKCLGYQEHHRIVALHDDTKHLHFHLAISRIHPLSFNNFEPYFDFQKLQRICRELERKHGLKGIERPSEARNAPIVEVRQAMESFETWLKVNVRKPLANALTAKPQSWEDIHRTLARFDVELRERGAGLVLSHRKAKIFVPASRIDRSFAKKNLEKTLGLFAPCQGEYLCAASYKLRPLLKTEAAMKLFDSYSSEKEVRQLAKKAAWVSYRARSSKEYEEVIGSHRKRCQALRLDRFILRERKREIFAKYSADLQKRLSILREKRKHERETITKNTRAIYWEAWLQDKAQAGNETALATLRDARKRRAPEGNIFEIKEPRLDRLDTEHHRIVGIDGAVRYSLPDGKSFTDFGSRIRIEGDRAEDINAALVFALRRYAMSQIEAKGSPNFVRKYKEMCIERRANGFEKPKGIER